NLRISGRIRGFFAANFSIPCKSPCSGKWLGGCSPEWILSSSPARSVCARAHAGVQERYWIRELADRKEVRRIDEPVAVKSACIRCSWCCFCRKPKADCRLPTTNFLSRSAVLLGVFQKRDSRSSVCAESVRLSCSNSTTNKGEDQHD